MLIPIVASAIAIVVIAFVLGVTSRSIPPAEPVSPFLHLDERKAAIYENLRDLQFEYRVGKLSDQDYQSTKRDLQKDLAGVLAEIDRIREGGKPATDAQVAKIMVSTTKVKKASGFTCDACGATFKVDLKFCGECGKPMKAAQS